MDGGFSVRGTILEVHIEDSFVGDFRRCPIRFAKRRVIIDGVVKIATSEEADSCQL